MVRKLLFGIGVLFFATANLAMAQLKVAYMDPQRVLNQLPERQQIEKELNDFIGQKRSELQAKTVDFQQQVADYQSKSNVLSEAEDKAAQDSLSVLNQELQEFQRGIQNDLQQKRAELLRPIYERMDKAIKAVASSRNIDFVLNENTSYGDPIIYYSADKKLDITDAVVKQMNESK